MSRSTRSVLIAAGAVALAVVALILLRPGEDDPETVPDEPVVETVPEIAPEGEPAGAPPEPTAALRFRDGEAVGGMQEIEVSRGDLVTLEVRSDVPEELHVHGYDIYADLEPGELERLEFEADIDGRFEIELHESHVPLARLTVQP